MEKFSGSAYELKQKTHTYSFFILDFFFAVLFRVHILLIEDYRDICFTPQGVDLILMITTALK